MTVRAVTWAALAMMLVGPGCAIKTLDVNDSDPNSQFRCRAQNKKSTVTFMFEDSASGCTLSSKSHFASLRTKRGAPAHWHLCNACNEAITVTVDVGDWSPIAGPWLEQCVADTSNHETEEFSRQVQAKSNAHIVCNVKDPSEAGDAAKTLALRKRGKTIASVHVDVTDASKKKRRVTSSTPDARVEDH